jgi:hypothetical protein
MSSWQSGQSFLIISTFPKVLNKLTRYFVPWRTRKRWSKATPHYRGEEMYLFNHRFTTLAIVGLGLLAFCPLASAENVFDDPETDTVVAPPKTEWRQKVLHNNSTAQQMTRESAQETEYRAAHRASYANQNPNANRNTEYHTAQRTSHQNSNRVRSSGVSTTSYNQPKNIRVAQHEIATDVQEEAADVQYEPMATEGTFAPQSECDSCGGDCGGSCGDSMECCPWMYPFGQGPRNLAIFGGVHGYKNSRDRGVNGNFGFTEGVNFGAPLGDPWGCGYQVGFAALQSNISGFSTTTTTGATADRHQYFFTAGVFRRAECAGWQWGVVFDYLHDTYIQNTNLKQIRTETGYLFNESFEIGYSGAYGVSGDSVNGQYFGRTIDAQLDATDQFVVYFRRYFENGGDGRIWGGMTGHGDGLFGADAWIPLGGSWALQNSFNYLIPKGSRGSSIDQNGMLDGGQIKESWSVAMNLVWYPGRSTNCISKSCYRPLLNVADNSLFMVRETATVAPR